MENETNNLAWAALARYWKAWHLFIKFHLIHVRRHFWEKPNYKTLFDLYLIVPPYSMVISKAQVVRRRRYLHDSAMIKFDSRPPMSAYRWNIFFADNLQKFIKQRTNWVMLSCLWLAPINWYQPILVMHLWNGFKWW